MQDNPTHDVRKGTLAMQSLIPTTITGIDGIYKNRAGTISIPVLTIGRLHDHNLSFPNDPLLSRNHARLYYDGSGWFCEDLMSTNGTVVDGRLVRGTKIRLCPGSVIRCGSQAFRIDFAESPEIPSPNFRPVQPASAIRYTIPPPPDNRTTSRSQLTQNEQLPKWVRLGEYFPVHGLTTSAGLMLVSTKARTQRNHVREPCLIDLSLAISFTGFNESEEHGIGYSYDSMPLYNRFSPGMRGRYLSWIAGDRKRIADSPDFLQLFLMTVEWRLLGSPEIPSPSEVSAIIDEVRRVIDINEASTAFGTKADSFIRHVHLRQQLQASSEDPLIEISAAWRQALGVQYDLAESAHYTAPLSAEVAFDFVMQDTETYPRTPARRCPEFTRKLFKVRYDESARRQQIVKPSKSKLGTSYRPWNSNQSCMSFTHPVFYEVAPSVAVLNRLRELLSSCTDELDAYSRHIGKKPYDADRLPAISLLPKQLLDNHPAMDRLRTYAAGFSPESIRMVPLSELVERVFGPAIPESLTKVDAQLMASSLGACGLAVEPDARYGSLITDLKATIAVSGMSDTRVAHLSTTFLATRALIDLASAVASSDGVVSQEEQNTVIKFVEGSMKVKPNERQRLKLYAAWALSQGSTNFSKQLITNLGDLERHEVMRFLVGVACCDGAVSPLEMHLLLRLAGEMKLPETIVYELVHGQVAATEPRLCRAQCGQFAAEGQLAPIGIDMESVRRKIAASEDVTQLLDSIFEDEPVISTSAVFELEESSATLDGRLRSFVGRLLNQPRWRREDFELEARAHGLMAGAAYEELNEFSLAHFDDPFLDGNEFIDLDEDIGRKILL